jgi:hypothetical protein
MDRIRSAIKAGTFPESMQELRATRAGTNGADDDDEGRVKSE